MVDAELIETAGRKFDEAMKLAPKGLRARCREAEAAGRAVVLAHAEVSPLYAHGLCANLERGIRACLDVERLLAYMALPPRIGVDLSEQLRLAAAAADFVGFYGSPAGERRAWHDPAFPR